MSSQVVFSDAELQQNILAAEASLLAIKQEFPQIKSPLVRSVAQADLRRLAIEARTARIELAKRAEQPRRSRAAQ